MNISFSPPYIDKEVIAEVEDSLRSGWITTGPKVAELEKLISKFTDTGEVLCINSATSGLMLALHWFGVGKGDEVIIPAYTYAATALVVLHLGAKPVMVDVGDDFNIDAAKVKEALNEKTKAIIPVDFAGLPCDYDKLSEIVNNTEIKDRFKPASDVQKQLGRILILADAAHSIGAKYKGRMSGSLADISVFSFHAVKNVTTAEGGAICINLPSQFADSSVYKTMKLWSLNGQTKDALTKNEVGSWEYDIVYPGFKINMPDICAAIAVVQLKKYPKMLLPNRKRVADRYHKFFKEKDWYLTPTIESFDICSSYHLYPLRIKNASEEARNKIIDFISQENVAVNVHFKPLPLLKLFRDQGYDIKNYPNAFSMYENEISLPIYPQLSNEEVDFVCETVNSSVEKVLKAS